MHRRSFLKFTAVSTAAFSSVFASGSVHKNATASELHKISLGMLDEIYKSNEYYVKKQHSDFFKRIASKQQPRVTLVGCSDSRFQMGAIDLVPEDDIFVVRNIGNQFITSEGSITYGVEHLHTPLLIILGHTRCGAIHSAMEDYGSEDSSLRRELDGLSLSVRKAYMSGDNKNEQWMHAVVSNINQQVAYSLSKFKHELHEGKLTVVGMVFDLGNDFGKGAGRLHIINYNGETDLQKLKEMAAVKPFL